MWIFSGGTKPWGQLFRWGLLPVYQTFSGRKGGREHSRCAAARPFSIMRRPSFRNWISMTPTTLSDDSFTPNEKRTLLGVALAAGLRILGVSLILPVFALYQDGMKASPAEIGLALGIYSFTHAAFQVPLRFLSARIGRQGVPLGGV